MYVLYVCVGVCAASEEGGLASSLRLVVSLCSGGIQYGGLPRSLAGIRPPLLTALGAVRNRRTAGGFNG